MSMLEGICGKTDIELLKSLSTFDLPEELVKSLGRQGLVQKDVTVKGKNGKTFTRKQWVRVGDGIYVADKSSKSAQYIGDEGYSRKGISGSLMIVEASLGNTLNKVTNSGHNYDSLYAGKSNGLLNNEWCVHDTHSVIPRYLVQMEIL